MEMDQTNKNEKPVKKNQRKRHGMGLGPISVALLLVIVGLIIFLCIKLKDGKNEPVAVAENVSLEVSDDTPKSVADKIQEELKESEEPEFEIIEFRTPDVEPEDLPVEEEGYNGESMELEFPSEQTAPEKTEEPEKTSKPEKTEEPESTEEAETEPTAEPTQKPVSKSSDPMSRVIDFATLQTKKNGHIYAWISVPGTNIDYPVLRHPTDDGYYLYHNLNGSEGYPGCIYTENWNSKDWNDPVTVLYGHDMRSTGTMFHQLHKFETQSFFDKNQYFYVYTPDKTLKYEIFAAYVHSNEHLLANHEFGNKDSFDAFFGTVLAASNNGANHVRDGVTVTSDSKIVTLSTCIKNKPNNRYLIFGVLIN